jgi:hypothetical protein
MPADTAVFNLRSSQQAVIFSNRDMRIISEVSKKGMIAQGLHPTGE